MAWNAGRLTSATLRTSRAGRIALRTAGMVRVMRAGKAIAVRRGVAGVVSFDAIAGGQYEVISTK